MTKDDINELVAEYGFDDDGVIIFENYDYASAFIGFTHDGRAVYNYELMLDYLIDEQGFIYEDAVEWIDYNTIRAIGYNSKDPIILFPINNEDF